MSEGKCENSPFSLNEENFHPQEKFYPSHHFSKFEIHSWCEFFVTHSRKSSLFLSRFWFLMNALNWFKLDGRMSIWTWTFFTRSFIINSKKAIELYRKTWMNHSDENFISKNNLHFHNPQKHQNVLSDFKRTRQLSKQMLLLRTIKITFRNLYNFPIVKTKKTCLLILIILGSLLAHTRHKKRRS
jgi:hypothetical protein